MLPQLDFTFFISQIFWTLVVFLTMYLFTTIFLFPKLYRILSKRKTYLDDIIREGDRYRNRAKKLISQYELEIDFAKKEAEKIVEEKYKTFQNLYKKSIEKEEKLLNSKKHELTTKIKDWELAIDRTIEKELIEKYSNLVLLKITDSKSF